MTLPGRSAGGPAVVGLGGGHGLATTLTAARRYAGAVAAVVSVADDGGSSGRLRAQLGIPAPGDVRRCLVALARDPECVWAKAFAARFDTGDLMGHALGNVVLAGLVPITGSFLGAVEEAGRLLDTCGPVLPATVEPVVISAVVDGIQHEGQTAIEAASGGPTTIRLQPADATAPEQVLERIAAADQIILGPGSLYTSVIAVTAVPSIRDAVAATAGQVVFVCNLKASKETVGYDVAAHVDALARHGVVPDVVLADPDAIDIGPLPAATRLVTAGLALENGWSHDARRLAEALSSLVG